MPIEKHKVVTLDYTLFDADDDRALEDSADGQPLLYLHGAGNILPALEWALAGKDSGDHVSVTLDAKDAYGERDETRVQRLPVRYLKHAGKPRPGKVVRVQTDQGPRMVTIIKVGLKSADVDANHPLAGRRLRFEMDIRDVREASADEKAHGHAHGAGGHDHH